MRLTGFIHPTKTYSRYLIAYCRNTSLGDVSYMSLVLDNKEEMIVKQFDIHLERNTLTDEMIEDYYNLQLRILNKFQSFIKYKFNYTFKGHKFSSVTPNHIVRLFI